jgi:peptidyl-prolyl cis-trans isomerase SurA
LKRLKKLKLKEHFDGKSRFLLTKVFQLLTFQKNKGRFPNVFLATHLQKPKCVVIPIQKLLMKKIVLFLCSLAFAFTSFAQTKKVVADKIIATVGDKIILKSDIDNAILDYQRQNKEVPANAGCLLLQQALAVKALVLQAERDSLPVSEDQINGEIDNRIRYYIGQYGSKEVLEQVAGKTVYQLKEEFKPIIRDQKLAAAERDKIVSDVRITPNEVEDYYSKIPKDSLPFYESQLEVGQIVIYPKPSRDLENYAIDQLKEYKKEVEDGSKKFEVLASLFSDDPGSKENGGLMEINRNQKDIDPTFLAKAFSLKDGQISSVFKSKFGYHIIQMVSKRGDDATIRYILKVPQVSSIEVNQTKQKLDSIRTLLVNGTLTFGEAVSKYSEDDNSKFTGGRLTAPDQSTLITIDDVHDKDLALLLPTLKVGEFSQPTEFADPYTGKKAVRIVEVLSKTEPHRENLKDDYDKVAQRALEEKKNAALDQWFDKKIPTFYVNIDPQYATCPEVSKWVENRSSTANK